MQDKARGIPGIEQKHMQILGLKKVLISSAKESLNQHLERSQKHRPSDDAIESSSGYETFSTKLPGGKRKRARERASILPSSLRTTKVRPSTKYTKRHNLDQEESTIGDSILPKTPFNSVAQRGPLDDVGSISSYIGAITGVQTDSHNTENNLEVTRAFGNSISRLHPNQSTSISIQNAHGIKPPTPGSDIIGTVDRKNPEQYCTGLEWSDFNACGRSTSQDQSSILKMRNLEQYHWGGANTGENMEEWSSSNDWSSFHAPFNGFHNTLASNI
ncbi:hypothetical protein BGZ60DRAFT_429398 [Tricladium varicosporioides]|nr:hypothetical protein BGZ60DRAFT_429398 [Hymenoscyphus varicosporioides]